MRILIVAIFSLGWLGASAQSRDSVKQDTLKHRKFLTMVNFNKDQSYVSFGSGLGNQRPILFEANLSPSYYISNQSKNWALVMNPQVQIRMLDEKSQPVQTPSYRFFLTYYHNLTFWKKSFLKRILYQDAIWFASMAHHSNGQSGEFYINDSTKIIDLENGNFAVNFIQLGVSSFTISPSGGDYFSLRALKIHTEIYPAGLSDPHLDGQYGYYRLFGTFDFAGPWKKEKNDVINRWLHNSSIEVKAGWIFGEFRSYETYDVDKRLILDISYKYYPPWFDEIAFFLRFYSGQDYYNIYYEKKLVNLSIGITSNTIKLSNAVRNMGTRRKQTGTK